MANLKAIKNRIRSVKSTSKITQAMKMVAAAKIKKAEAAAVKSRPFSQFLTKIFAQLSKANGDITFSDTNFESALENYPALLEKRNIKNVGLLVITSDKGLAGAYNSNVIKKTVQTVDEYKAQGINTKLFVVGIKGITALKRLFSNTETEIIKCYSKIPPLVEVEVAKMIAEDLAQNYVNKNIDSIEVISTEYINMLSHQIKQFSLLPLVFPTEHQEGINPEMIFEPSKEEILKKLVPFYIANTVYNALKNAMASELSARMNAMTNATNNAEEIVKNLSVQYNKIRQYNITQEIIEVVSGANSIN